MSVYKSFNQDQIHYRTTTVNKTFNENQDSDGVYTIHLISGSTNEDSSSYYNTINTLFYYKNGRSGAHLSQGNIYSYSSYYKNPQHKNKYFNEAVLINVSSSKFGDSIKPGSFTLNVKSTGSVQIKDDSYGNLYATNASNYNDITEGTPSSSISSSENYIGNIFYETGIAVLTETGSYSDGCHYTSSGDSFDIQFDSTITIPTMEYNCRVEPGEFNSTLNPTILSSSAAVTSSMNIKAEYYNKMGKQNYSPLPYQLNLTSLDRRFISDKFKNDKFRTYITKIGLYNDKNQLIMVASLPVPVQVSKKQPLNIKVRMDY